MRVIFAHDFPMIKDENKKVYSSGAFPYTVWKRYLVHFDGITVFARKGNLINSNDKNVVDMLSVSSGPNVDFVTIPNLSSIKGKLTNTHKAKQIMEEELLIADFLIARLPSEIGKLAIKVAKENDIPYLIELVGCPYDAHRFYGSIKGKIYAPISWLQTRKILKQSKFTIYVTKCYLQKKYPTKGLSTSISNVNISEVNKDVSIKRLQSLRSLNHRTLKIGMIGSLNSRYKGFDRAIKYISDIKPHNDDYEIHILGEGNSSYLNSIIKEHNMISRVHFDGTRQSGKEVFQWLDNIDLYLHPSLTEGLPRALIEAMSRGCLVIGSNRGGIPELLNADFVYNPLNPKSLNRCFQNALTNSFERQVNNNIDKANEYSSDKLTKKRDDFINKFIDVNK